jgi:phage gp46-like protein
VTITRVNFSASVAVGTTSVNAGDPVGGTPGDLLLLYAWNKYNLPNNPAAYGVPKVQHTGGQGAAGLDSGNVNATVWSKIEGVAEPSAVTVSVTGGNALMAFMELLTSDLVQAGTHQWILAVSKGADNSAGTAWSVTGDVDPDIRAGDVVIAISSINGNGPGAGWWSSLSLTTPGVTYGALFDAGDGFTSNGDDMALRYVAATATAGVSSGPPVFSMTASSTTGNQPAGCTVFVRLREVPIVSEATGTAAGTSSASAAGSSIAEAIGTAAGTSTASATGGVVQVIDLTPPEEETVGDIYLVWEAGTIDLSMRKDDVAEDLGLRTACLLSLFTDRRAEDDDPLPALDNDRRGWWADEFAQVQGDKIGSRLWLLDRSKRTGDVVRRAEELTREALQWMLEDRVAERIDVVVDARQVALLIAVTLFRPQRDPVTFRFAHVWDGELIPDQPDELVPGFELFRWDAGQGWDEGVWG